MEHRSDEYPFMVKYARLLAQKHTRQFLFLYRSNHPHQFKALPDTKRAFMGNREFRNRVTSNLFCLFKNIRIWGLLDDRDRDSICSLTMKTAWRWFQVLNKKPAPVKNVLKQDIHDLLRNQIRMITPEQCSMLIDGKLPAQYRINTGLYLVQEADGTYIACDYSMPEYWVRAEESGGFPRHFVYLPDDGEGWVEEFDNPLDAIDYLLGVSPDKFREE